MHLQAKQKILKITPLYGSLKKALRVYEHLHFSFTMDVETYQDIEPEKEKGTVEEIILRQVC